MWSNHRLAGRWFVAHVHSCKESLYSRSFDGLCRYDAKEGFCFLFPEY